MTLLSAWTSALPGASTPPPTHPKVLEAKIPPPRLPQRFNEKSRVFFTTYFLPSFKQNKNYKNAVFKNNYLFI